MNKAIITSALSAALLLSPAVQAGHKDDYKYRHKGYFQDYGKVIAVKPIIHVVDVSEPREECWDEPVNRRSYNRASHRPAAGEMILGAVIGGAIGNQVGHGRDRDRARLAGAVIGAAIGHDKAQQRHSDDYRDDAGEYDRVGYERRCRVSYDRHQEERIEGYRVTYKYRGQIFKTRMPYDPGDRIPVEVSVRPVRR